MTLTSEQQKAVDLAAEIKTMGGNVVSLLPPPLDNLVLRFQVAAGDMDDQLVAKLREWGWTPRQIGRGPWFHVLGHTTTVCSYELYIPVERTPVLEGRHTGELSEGKAKVITEADKLLAEFNRKK
jgi:hypothetical protein